MVKNTRVDQALVDRSMVRTLEEAKRLIMAGKIRHLGQVVMKASRKIPDQDEITIIPGPKYVSRGGEKLAAALDYFQLSVNEKICADVGASTGGFTDCLLENGALRVYAIDVGYGILDWQLRNDPRVKVLERTNARNLSALPEPVERITVDVSFISLKKILPVIKDWFSVGGGEAVVLIKPQFEATKQESSRGKGVILDPVIHQRILTEVLGFARDQGYQIKGLIRSPLKGPEGNTEFLAWLAFPGSQGKTESVAELISTLFLFSPETDPEK
ncbi:MAG: TlyA family RNA methyltransferase [Anaerolineales bacterium]|nr:TlyA family RNA methyltransferase [Anaerolineales bacterium]